MEIQEINLFGGDYAYNPYLLEDIYNTYIKDNLIIRLSYETGMTKNKALDKLKDAYDLCKKYLKDINDYSNVLVKGDRIKESINRLKNNIENSYVGGRINMEDIAKKADNWMGCLNNGSYLRDNSGKIGYSLVKARDFFDKFKYNIELAERKINSLSDETKININKYPQ